MKRTLITIAATLFVASCASVPRDLGTADVRQRTSLDWNADTRAMLAHDLTADEAVAVAVANNPRLQATLAELGIARADLIEASTIANPIFEFEWRIPGEPYHPYEVRLAQSLIDLIQLPRRRAAGRIAFAAAQMRVSSEVLRFASDVRAAYFDVIAASQHVAQNRVLTEAARTAAEVALKQHTAENITDLELENEQANYEQAKLDLSRSERELAVAREALARWLNAGSEWTVPASFPELPASEPDQQQLEQAALQRLDIAIARRELELAQRRVPMARLAALGEIEVDAHFEREPSGEHTTGPGIMLPIPIFNTGRAARTRAEAEYVRARETVRALESESASRLRAAKAVAGEARARVEYYRDVVLPRRKRIVELTKLEHNAMLVGIYTLLQARQNEAMAESDSIEAQREYWIARTNLDRAVQGIAREQ